MTTGVDLGPGNSLRALAPAGDGAEGPKSYRVSEEFRPLPFSASGEARAAVVFVGYGITASEFNYDDYAGVDVAGKVVVALRYEPREKAEKGPLGEYRPSRFSDIRFKATVARDKGAAAFVLVTGPLHHEDEGGDLIPLQRGGTIGGDVGIPSIQARREVVEGWLEGSGKSLASIQESIERDLAGGSFAIPGLEIAVKTDLRLTHAGTANVIGILRGSDPKLAGEAVVVGAHYDHLGRGGEGSLAPSESGVIHNGADDNASGTAGVLEIARAFAQSASRPRRSVVFIAFSGEEMGLLGSAHYVKHPVVPLEKTVAMVNLDMIGRLREGKVLVGGVGTSPGFTELVRSQAEGLNLTLKESPEGLGPSDHSSFYTKGLPVFFFWTGVHADYHKPTDDADKVDARGARTVARLAYRVTASIADADARPAFQSAGPAPAPTGDSGAGSRPSLGTVPDYTETEGGVHLADVRPGSAAEKAGIRKGDTIVRFAGKPIKTIYDFTYALSAQKAGDTVEIVVLRDGSEVTVRATLGKGGAR